jgi:fibrillarin-like pre-rRNA processing protein
MEMNTERGIHLEVNWQQLIRKVCRFDFSKIRNILYLGASTGTTVSHLSDIIGHTGKIFAVESSARVARELITNVSSKRTNVIPIIEDARKPRGYFSIYDKMDLVYCDIAQPDQTNIAMDNCKIYLKEEKPLLLVIKTRSIDVTMSPKNVISQEIRRLEEQSFKIKQNIDLAPFDKDHAMVEAIFCPA